MRKSLLLAVLAASVTAGGLASAGDDLLSEIRLDSTVAPTETKRDEPSTASRPKGKGVGGASSLQTLLLAAGYSAKITNINEVTVSISRGDWTADVKIRLADDGSQLRIAAELPAADESAEVGSETLRALLNANRKQWSMAFALTEDARRIELRRAIANESLSSSTLRNDLDEMADYAEKTAGIWKGAATSAPVSEPVAKETPKAESTPTTPATTPAAAPTLTGKWIASTSKNEAFALQLDSDSSFRLVHVRGNKPTRSEGTYQLTSTTLTLKGTDGKTLSGTIARQTGSFTFTLKGANGKSVALNFKSSP